MSSYEPEVLEAVYQEYADRVFRFCLRLCGSREDAEDLSQDVLVAACRSFRGFQGRAMIPTWLCGIAIKLWRRRRRREVETVSMAVIEDISSGPDPVAARLEHLSVIEAVAALPEYLRQPFILVRAEGLSYKEAGEALGVAPGTVAGYVHDAGERLRRMFGETEAPCGSEKPGTRKRPGEEGTGPIRVAGCPSQQVIHEV